MNNAFQAVDRKLLGYGGKLYPIDMIIEVRGAGVTEIREWSNINEKDVTSIAKHVIDIITKCTRVTSAKGGKHYSVKDIYEHDKLVLLLLIHQLTFADKKDNMLYVSGECSGSSCGRVFDKLAITPANLTFKVPNEKYDKYIDADNGKFVITTRSHGTIEYKPSTIGLGNAMLSWIQTFKPKFVEDNQSMLRLVQSLCTDWRLANDKYLRRLQIEQYNNMTSEELSFRTELLEQITIELSDELEYVCPDCGATFRSKLAIDGGYRKMFMPVQSLDDELL